MKRFVIPTLLAVACGSALAADPFTGANVGVSLGYTDNTVKYSGMLSGSTGDNDFAGKLRAGYGFAMGDKWVGTVGLSYQLNKVKFGHDSYRDRGVDYDVTLKLKNDLELSFAPGYRLTPDSLLYAKLGYHWAKSEYDDEQVGSGTLSHHGVGVGLGYLAAINSNLSVGVEAEHITYSRESANLSSGKPTQNALNFILDYRF